MNTPTRDNTSANDCRIWIVLEIDFALGTDPVSVHPSRLDDVRYCLIRINLDSEMLTANKYAINCKCSSKSMTKYSNIMSAKTS